MSKNGVKKARLLMNSFNARGSKCPICKKDFRYGCDHSVNDAKDRLTVNYIQAIAREANRKV